MTEIQFRLYAYWLTEEYIGEPPQPFAVNLNFFIPYWGWIAGQLVDLTVFEEGAVPHVYGPYSFAGLSFTKAQVDAMTCEMEAWLPTTPPGHPNLADVIVVVDMDYRLTYIAAPADSKHKMDIGMGMSPGFR